MLVVDTLHDGKINIYNYKEGIDIITEELKKSIVYVKGKKELAKNYTNIIMSFDVETTKVLNDLYDPKKHTQMYKYFNVVFCWQVSINGKFVFGRSVTDFFKMVDAVNRINKKGFIICYIHNFAYEYNNLADYFISRVNDREKDLFFKSHSQPLFIRCGSFEFRCSKELTHKSLAKIGKDIGYNKLKGDFDYNIERYINTELSALEVNYCYRDVIILDKFIKQEIKNYAAKMNLPENPAILPLTSTGYVRSDVQKNFSRTPKGHYILQHTALTEQEYDAIRSAFWGGFTHADYKKIGKEFHDVSHRDITSAYPSQFLKTFPYKLTKGTMLDKELFFSNLKRKNFAIIAKLTITDIQIKKDHMIPYLPTSKCEEFYNGKLRKFINNDNGKIYGAPAVTFWACDIDINIILDVYEYTDVVIHEYYYGFKKVLPYRLVNTVLGYFKAKTEYKNVEGKEFEYAYQKALLNSVYGLSATACRHDDLTVLGLDTVATGSTYKPSNTIPFQWAIYITAYVRQLLYGFIKDLANMNDAYIYSDTDSIFYLPSNDTEQYFEEYNNKNKKFIEHWKHLYNNILPSTSEGLPQYLGSFLDEHDDIKNFATIGSKRYYVTHSDGLTELTFAGLSGTKIEKVNGQKQNGFNTNRLIQTYGSIQKAFETIRATEDGSRGIVALSYVEGVDKLSNYNTRFNYEGTVCGIKVYRPCAYVLYGQSTKLSLNQALYDLITKEGLL